MEKSNIDGLVAARTVWSRPKALAYSAPFIYLHLIAAPEIMKVELRNSDRLQNPNNTARDLQITAGFICNIVGLSEHQYFQGGKDNPLVAVTVVNMGERHRGFAGMEEWMIAYFAYYIAMAPLLVLNRKPLFDSIDKAYLGYMSEAWKLMGVELDLTEPDVHREYLALSKRLIRPWSEAAHFLSILRQSLDILLPDESEHAWQQMMICVIPEVVQVVETM